LLNRHSPLPGATPIAVVRIARSFPPSPLFGRSDLAGSSTKTLAPSQ
jgi:hypothetical protein